jgi:hypothetical protein
MVADTTRTITTRIMTVTIETFAVGGKGESSRSRVGRPVPPDYRPLPFVLADIATSFANDHQIEDEGLSRCEMSPALVGNLAFTAQNKMRSENSRMPVHQGVKVTLDASLLDRIVRYRTILTTAELKRAFTN